MSISGKSLKIKDSSKLMVYFRPWKVSWWILHVHIISTLSIVESFLILFLIPRHLSSYPFFIFYVWWLHWGPFYFRSILRNRIEINILRTVSTAPSTTAFLTDIRDLNIIVRGIHAHYSLHTTHYTLTLGSFENISTIISICFPYYFCCFVIFNWCLFVSLCK